MKHELKKIGIISVMKISAVVGLVCGVLYALIMVPLFLLGSMASGGGTEMLIFLVVIVVCAMIGFPIMMAVSYGIMAALYNLFAKSVGGVEFELEEKK
jgi:hypothetical protein